MTKRIILLMLVIAVLLLGAGCATTAKQPAPKPKAQTPASKQRQDTRKIVQVKMINFGFEPPRIAVGVNDIVDWQNQDSAQHTVHADDDAWQSGPLNQGDHFEQSFKQPGTYAYHCSIHPSMTGTVVVK